MSSRSTATATLAAGALILALALPVLAADPSPSAAACAATLTADAVAGTEIDLAGAGWTPGATVSVEVQRHPAGGNIADGSTAPETWTLSETADAGGAWSQAIPTGPGLGGSFVFTATAGDCTATASAVAVETAGGLNPDGVIASPMPDDGGTVMPILIAPAPWHLPDTSTVDPAEGRAPSPASPALAALAVLVAIAGLGLTVRVARR